VNAAFNSGNSGGPLLLIETGEVIGVVSSKLAPISREAASALTALENQQSGFANTATRRDGSTFNIPEGQIVAMILRELRRQVQLVIGYAVLLDDVKAFLNTNGINP
jgi:S1-C subfamily serine protease